VSPHGTCRTSSGTFSLSLIGCAQLMFLINDLCSVGIWLYC